MPRRRTKDMDMPSRVYKHGRWWRFIPPPPGKPVKLGTTKTEALRAYAEMMDIGGTFTFGQALDRYLAEITPTKSKTTQPGEQAAARKLRQWCGHIALSEIRTQHVYQYVDVRGRQSVASANRELSLLKSVFQRSVRWGYVEHNPCQGVERLTQHARGYYLPDADFIALLKLAREKRREYVALAAELGYLTGLRRSDLLRIKLSDVNFQGIEVVIGKSGKMGAPPKRAIVEWTDHLRALVAKAKASCREQGALYLIHRADGQPPSMNGFNNAWQYLMKCYAEQGGTRFQFKDIRAKHATDFDAMGGDAAANLTHSNPATTRKHYLRKPAKIRPLE